MSDYDLLRQVYFKPTPGTLSEPTAQARGALKALKTLKKSGRLSLDTVWLLVRFSKMILNPDDISPIFKGGAFLKHKSFAVSLQTFYEDPSTATLLQERYLSATPYDLKALQALPAGTLGHEFAEHMMRNQLEVVFYPPLEPCDNDDIAYLRKRARQTHDIHHVVLGYPAIDVGEMAISAFYLAQHNVPLSALLIGFGFLYTILREPQRISELMTALELGWKTGQQTPKLLGVRWEEYWESPLSDVRQRLGIPTPQSRFPWALSKV